MIQSPLIKAPLNSKQRKKEKILKRINEEKQERLKKRAELEFNSATKAFRKERRWKDNRWNVHRLRQYTTVKETPHPLYLVTFELYQKFKDNCIIISNMTRNMDSVKSHTDGGIITFEKVSYGSNVAHLERRLKSCDNDSFTIDVSSIKGHILLIICPMKEFCLMQDPNISYLPKDERKDSFVMLSFCIFHVETLLDTTIVPLWNNSIHLNQL